MAAGIEVATGELLRTMETVAGDRSRYSASILRVAGLSGSGRLFLPVIVLRGMDVQHMATVVHLRQGVAHSGEIGYESLLGNERIEITNYRQKRELFNDIASRLSY